MGGALCGLFDCCARRAPPLPVEAVSAFREWRLQQEAPRPEHWPPASSADVVRQELLHSDLAAEVHYEQLAADTAGASAALGLCPPSALHWLRE